MTNEKRKDVLKRLPQNFVFFDLETSGLSICFDQLFQIAAIRTGQDLVETGEPRDRFSYRARRRPHIVPSAAAMLTTGLRPEDIETGLPQADVLVDAAARLRKWSPAIFCGYNSARFDLPFLSHRLFESLEQPYLMRSAGSVHADVMRMAQAAFVLAPEALTVPTNVEGMRSFRLGPLVRANGLTFPEDSAHEALADVRATINLARLLKARAPNVFDETLALADKQYVFSILEAGCVALMLRVVRGTPIVLPIAPLGVSEEDANAIICLDLTVAPDIISAASDDELLGVDKAWPAPVFTVRANAQPLVWRYDSAMPEIERLRALLPASLPRDELLVRCDRLLADKKLVARARDLIAARQRARPAPQHLEERLYEGFASRQDFMYASMFHGALPFERGPIVQFLLDQRLREHALRIMFETHPGDLDGVNRRRLNAWRRNRVLGPIDAPWRTLAAARAELTELSQGARNATRVRLNAIRQYFDWIKAESDR